MRQNLANEATDYEDGFGCGRVTTSHRGAQNKIIKILFAVASREICSLHSLWPNDFQATNI